VGSFASTLSVALRNMRPFALATGAIGEAATSRPRWVPTPKWKGTGYQWIDRESGCPHTPGGASPLADCSAGLAACRIARIVCRPSAYSGVKAHSCSSARATGTARTRAVGRRWAQCAYVRGKARAAPGGTLGSLGQSKQNLGRQPGRSLCQFAPNESTRPKSGHVRPSSCLTTGCN
jgi:hypothetical protein